MEASLSSSFYKKCHRNDAEFFSVHSVEVCALLICCITGDINSYYFVKFVYKISLLEVNKFKKSMCIGIPGEIIYFGTMLLAFPSLCFHLPVFSDNSIWVHYYCDNCQVVIFQISSFLWNTIVAILQ